MKLSWTFFLLCIGLQSIECDILEKQNLLPDNFNYVSQTWGDFFSFLKNSINM